MKFSMLVLSVAAFGWFAPSVFAQGAPFTPTPDSGVETPYNSDRDAPASHPSASVSSVAHCAPSGSRSTLLNGASVPAATEPSGIPTRRSNTQVVIVNGASIPTSGIPADDTWCGGAYREDWGTNFGSR
jgi:hypothetical protein